MDHGHTLWGRAACSQHQHLSFHSYVSRAHGDGTRGAPIAVESCSSPRLRCLTPASCTRPRRRLCQPALTSAAINRPPPLLSAPWSSSYALAPAAEAIVSSEQEAATLRQLQQQTQQLTAEMQRVSGAGRMAPRRQQRPQPQPGLSDGRNHCARLCVRSSLPPSTAGAVRYRACSARRHPPHCCSPRCDCRSSASVLF